MEREKYQTNQDYRDGYEHGFTDGFNNAITPMQAVTRERLKIVEALPPKRPGNFRIMAEGVVVVGIIATAFFACLSIMGVWK